MIEITLAVVLLVTVFMAFSWIKTSRKVRDIKEDIVDLKIRLNNSRELIEGYNTNIKQDFKGVYKSIGYDESFCEYSGYVYKFPSNSVHQRINFLMDHLNLEIKDSEPSKTTLVKKKPIKRGK